MSSQQFNTVYPLFAAKGVRAIGIDQPGFGMSDPTTLAPTATEWAKIVPAVLDHLGIAQADIAGHYTGSTVALAAASLFPDRIRSVSMHAALLVSEDERAKRKHKPDAVETSPYKLDGSHLTDAYMSRFKMYGPGDDPKLITRYTVERFMATGVSWHAHEVAYQYDSGAALRKLKTRAMVIGNDGDMIIDMTRRIKDLRPDIKYVELKGGGVDITDQSPQEWVDAIVDFIRA
jgi:pimeloyl-ACP methyl ester carboxylesterase